MASQNDHSDERPSSDATRLSSCRRRKNFGSGSFVNDVRDHIHEFLHSSMDEHRTCLKDSMQKMFEKMKAFGEKRPGPVRESSLPLQTTSKD